MFTPEKDVLVHYIVNQKYSFIVDGVMPLYVDFNEPPLFDNILLPYQAIVKAMCISLSTSKVGPSNSSPSAWAMQFSTVLLNHPVTSKEETLYYIIINLNDEYHWTREQIADWLETTDQNPIITKSETKEPNNVSPF